MSYNSLNLYVEHYNTDPYWASSAGPNTRKYWLVEVGEGISQIHVRNHRWNCGPTTEYFETFHMACFFAIFDPHGPKPVLTFTLSTCLHQWVAASLVLFSTLVGPPKHSAISKNHTFMYHSPLFELKIDCFDQE